jgi:hypothetical protein
MEGIHMRRMVFCAGLLAPSLALAGVLNVEFKFTPYTGNLEQDHVQTVAGKARVFLNGALVAEQDVASEQASVLFDEREIQPSVWVPAASMGPALRKGHNRLRIEFVPTDAKAPYKGQLSWATVNDQVVESDDGAGTHTSSNQSGEGKEDRPVTGKLVFDREFNADFATDRPWHHYPPLTSLSEAEKASLLALVRARGDGFKPPFEPLFASLAAHPEMQVGEIRKSRCVDAAYAAGIRVSPVAATDVEFSFVGGPEVVLSSKGGGPLYDFGDKANFDKIKGDEQQMCAAFVLSAAYPLRMAFVRDPSGKWEFAY